MGEESVPFEMSLHRILAEDLVADRDFPPFDRVMMDGIAFRFEDFEKGQRSFTVQEMQAAGAEPTTLGATNNCIEIMTGASIPENADTVVRYEDLKIENGVAHLLVDNIKFGQNVHLKGMDRKLGTLLVPSGRTISAAEINIAASVGKSRLSVKKVPEIAIISTGDELVNVNQKPLGHQIRRSNVFAISALLSKYGVKAKNFHVNDDPYQIHRYLLHALENFHAVILSGGVSKGNFDYIPEELEKLQVEKIFHFVKQRPGKPFWFGKTPMNKVVFALPGNPVSSFMCTCRYVVPWLRASLGLKPLVYKYAALSKDFSFKPDLQYFLQVRTAFVEGGQFYAIPVIGHGSGDLANLADADGFLELPASKSEFKAGEAYPLLSFR
jgi:molybdopterin molybdotransferase